MYCPYDRVSGPARLSGLDVVRRSATHAPAASFQEKLAVASEHRRKSLPGDEMRLRFVLAFVICLIFSVGHAQDTNNDIEDRLRAIEAEVATLDTRLATRTTSGSGSLDTSVAGLSVQRRVDDLARRVEDLSRQLTTLQRLVEQAGRDAASATREAQAARRDARDALMRAR